MTNDALKERLSTRAKAFISNPDLVDDGNLDIAVNEAIELAGEESPLPVLTDIAFYRFLLLVETNGIDEVHLKAYKVALNQITDPASPNAKTKPKAKPRDNQYL